MVLIMGAQQFFAESVLGRGGRGLGGIGNLEGSGSGAVLSSLVGTKFALVLDIHGSPRASPHESTREQHEGVVSQSPLSPVSSQRTHKLVCWCSLPAGLSNRYS